MRGKGSELCVFPQTKKVAKQQVFCAEKKYFKAAFLASGVLAWHGLIGLTQFRP